MKNSLFDDFLDLGIGDGRFGLEGVVGATGLEEVDELG